MCCRLVLSRISVVLSPLKTRQEKTLRFCPTNRIARDRNKSAKVTMAAPLFPVFSAAFARRWSRFARISAIFERAVSAVVAATAIALPPRGGFPGELS
jgi:hypothetical protein